MLTPIMHEVTLEHETETAIIDVTATVWFDVDVWVVDFATPVPAGDQKALEARFIAQVEADIAKHNREMRILSYLNDRAAF